MTLQFRLALFYLALASACVALLGGGSYLIAQKLVFDSVDDGLRTRAQAVEASLVRLGEQLSMEDIELARQGLDRQALTGSIFQLESPEGSVLYSSLGVGRPLPGRRSSVEGFSTIRTSGDELRVFATPVVRLGKVIGHIETRTSLSPPRQSLAAIRLALLLSGIIVITGTSAGAYYIAGRAVRPVKQAARLAKEIEYTADFTRTLPESKGTAEMEELTAAFNGMIARIGRLVSTQKTFLSDSSHELRRPLTSLRTNIDVINSPLLAMDERKVVEQEMREAAETMSSLLSDLLVLARSDERASQFAPLDLSEICSAVMRAAAMSDIWHEYSSRIDPCVYVVGDTQGLRNAVSNLVQNAASYSPAKTEIRLTLETVGNIVRIRIEDDGPGMSPEDLGHAFDRFYRGQAARTARPEGFGLGLAIVKQIIDTHRGTISLKSLPDMGTTVEVLLPLARVSGSMC